MSEAGTEQAAPETEAPAEAPVDTASEEAPAAPDVSEQVALLQQRLDKVDPPQPEAPDLDAATLADRLLGADPDADYEDTLPEYGDDQYQQQAANDPYMQEIQGIKSYLQGEATKQRLGELDTLIDEFPELKTEETQQKVSGALNSLVEEYGDSVLTNPRLLRTTLIALKAEAASANETPAEEARNRGASLETDAGARADSGESDYQSEVQRAIVEAGPPPSAFG